MSVSRFAPSPTGLLHLGHAYSALLAFDLSAGRGGRFVLRLEDIDPGRCRPEFEAAILEDLAWLGLRWEAPVWRQSQRLDLYAEALQRLRRAGLIYPCFCTRKEVAAEIARAVDAPHGPEGAIYPGICRTLAASERAARIDAGQPHAWRLDMAAALSGVEPLQWQDAHAGVVTADTAAFGDVVLARKETPTSYHLACTLDDALQGVDLIVRGEDLFAATDVHRLLQALLGLPTPRYHHHKLLRDEQGRRYAKRDRALTLRALREAGESAAGIRRRVGL
ncbi:tRNA glutamyl-Q(34) synthetase GluQRS [Magnetofaba australis]|uniref:tRNA glutamyl-Q(34) synthetase GluQRS n=1 Tax=Magnetofaba australis TaxID=1472297 RepID=UPI000A19B958|nr:tRNA glutamyl-Q(34) synthetase GluQRS [Magnetofaba australis]